MSLASTGEYIAVATKASPPLAVSAVTSAGIGLQEWVYIVTIIYTVLMIANLVYKFIRDRN